MHPALALAHTAKPQPFNADFYTVVATVIPVLYHALAVQIPTFVRVFRALGHATPGEQQARWQAIYRVASAIVAAALQFILGAGVIAAGGARYSPSTPSTKDRTGHSRS